MIVLKFGGSSLKNPDRIRAVVEIIRQRKSSKPVVVLSALGSTTDNLLHAGEQALRGKVSIKQIEQHHNSICQGLGISSKLLKPFFDELLTLLQGIALIKEISPRTKDHLVSFGERLSVRIIHLYAKKIGLSTKFYDSYTLGFITNHQFTQAELLTTSPQLIRKKLRELTSKSSIPLITGFLGKTEQNEITTLGRGGSDLTASLIGVALKAKEIQFWKDVDGVLSGDPRLVKHPRSMSVLSFEQAAELAYFGAKLFHPRSIIPAVQAGIPVRVKNSYQPQKPGTVIVDKLKGPQECVKSITHKQNVTVVDIHSTRMLGQHGFLSKVFELFSMYEISVDLVATSEVSVSVTLEGHTSIDRVRRELSKIAQVKVFTNKTIISLVGDVSQSAEILSRTFTFLLNHHVQVHMISQGASKVNISLVVDDNHAQRCIQGLHEVFFGGVK